MRATWHRSEPREIRPFFGSVLAKDAVADSKIRLFDDREPTADMQFDIEEPELQRLHPLVYPILVSPARWMPDGYEAGEFGLVILATNAFLRQSAVIKEIPLNRSIPESIELPLDIMEDLGGGRNLTITGAVHLRADRPPAPGQPFVVGHWLARKDFALRMPSEGRFFDVQFRSDEEWRRFGFPEKTFYAIDYHGGICDPMDPESSIATVWVHEDCYTRLSTDRQGGIAKFLACEVIVQILQESFEDWKDLESVDPASPLARVLKKIDRNNPISIEELKSLVVGSRKNQIRALLHDDMGLVRALV
jgi:hypothetical protein